MYLTDRELSLLLHILASVVLVHGMIPLHLGVRRRGALASPEQRWLLVLALLAWVVALSGTYFNYPGYRALPTDYPLQYYPRAALLDDPRLRLWHDFGMEWKEHIGWFAPLLLTAAGLMSVALRRLHPQPLRDVRLVMFVAYAGWSTVLISGLLGILINTVAPNLFLDIQHGRVP